MHRVPERKAVIKTEAHTHIKVNTGAVTAQLFVSFKSVIVYENSSLVWWEGLRDFHIWHSLFVLFYLFRSITSLYLHDLIFHISSMDYLNGNKLEMTLISKPLPVFSLRVSHAQVDISVQLFYCLTSAECVIFVSAIATAEGRMCPNLTLISLGFNANTCLISLFGLFILSFADIVIMESFFF